MEAEPEVLAASVESTSEKKVWPELALRRREGEPAVGLAERGPANAALGNPWEVSAVPQLCPAPSIPVEAELVHSLPIQSTKSKASLLLGGDTHW